MNFINFPLYELFTFLWNRESSRGIVNSMIHRDEVKKLAELALLAVDDSELDTLTKEMDSILEYISEINTFTADIKNERKKPLLYNVMREDEVMHKEGEYTERILKEMPSTDGKYLNVKKIL